MPIPREILNVKRPKNTVIICHEKNKDLFAIRQCVGCKNVDGKHVSVNSPTMGHIVNGEYNPIPVQNSADISLSKIYLKDWANVVLCDRVFNSMMSERLVVYSQLDTMKIYCMAILRLYDESIKDFEQKRLTR